MGVEVVGEQDRHLPVRVSAAAPQGNAAQHQQRRQHSAQQRFMVFFLPVSNKTGADVCPPQGLFYHNPALRESPSSASMLPGWTSGSPAARMALATSLSRCR